MAESESHSNLASPGEGEVERLLREAESLTQEVARATGTPQRDADALLSGELTSAPDPLAAVAAASTSIMSLEDLLSELGPAPAPQDQPTDPKRRASNASRRTEAPGATTAELPARTDEAKNSARIEIETRRPGPRVEHMPGKDDAASAAQTATDALEANAQSIPQKPAEISRPPRKPLGRRLLGGSKAAARGAGTLGLLVVRDLPIGLLSFVDVPFRRTPRPIKNAIGIIGAITLGMGALAWALPDLMRPSPPSPAGADSHAEAPAAQGSGHAGGH